MNDRVQEQALEAVRHSRPQDYDGHTEFDRMTPGQRLETPPPEAQRCPASDPAGAFKWAEVGVIPDCGISPVPRVTPEGEKGVLWLSGCLSKNRTNSVTNRNFDPTHKNVCIDFLPLLA